MNIKKLSLLITALLTITSVNAQQVSEQEALMKAQQFFGKANQPNASRDRAPRKAPKLMLANNRSEFYVFNDEVNGGYVVICGDERMPDVLAYSYDGSFDTDNLPCNMQAWMEEYAEQVKYLRAHPEAKVRKQTAAERENIKPLLTCWYAQRAPYNNKCPNVNGKPSATGCVATAMAQIMYYYQWPKQTTDVIPGYVTKTKGIDMPAIPVTTIDWSKILNQYNSNSSGEQANAISTLMLLCGTSIQMDYGLDGSAGSIRDAKSALRRYWGYDNLLEMVERDDYGAEEWEQLMYDELKDRRPILYSGRSSLNAGHAFVLDGYADGYFHINWGWGGDESYVLMTVPEGWREFVSKQSAVIGIVPDSPDFPHRYAVFDNGKMTFYYDKEIANRSGTILQNVNEFPNYIQTSDYSETITECVIDPSFANIKQRDLSRFFCGWKNLKSIQGIENLNTSRARDMECMFLNCQNLESLDLSDFNTDNVTNMRDMFMQCYNLTSLDASRFNTENVTNMNYMFGSCKCLTDLNVSSFKTDNVTTMYGMFANCSNLTSLDVSRFNTENVEDMSLMFEGCSCLTSLDLSNFKTDNVTNMERMFSGCSGLTSLDLSNFKTENVTDMSLMFEDCYSLTSLDLSNFKTDNVTDMNGIFSGCYGLTSLDVSGFNTENVTDMNRMFEVCSSLTSLDVSGFKTEKVTNMYSMFDNCRNLTSLDVSHFKTDNVTDMNRMFATCDSLKCLDVSGFNTENVTNMRGMFSGCERLTNLDVSGFNTDNVKNMRAMFNYCSSLTSLDVSHFKTDNVTDMGRMFDCCSSLTSLDVSGFMTNNVTDMNQMFCYCSKLKSLDLSGFKTDNVKNMKYMFANNSTLSTIYISELWNMSNVEESGDMFYRCSNLVGGAGTTYDENHTDGKYAHVDGGPDNPGYFTYKEIPDAIDNLTPDLQTVRIYDLQGKQSNYFRKGLNIVVMSDGTVKKVAIK